VRRLSRSEFEARLTRIIEALRAYEPRQMILFGSFARGDYNAMSDVDLLIVKDTERPFLDRISDVLALCDYDIALEPLIYTPEELRRMLEEGNSFLQTILEEGIVVYE
jgi:predicted nucleotidyltransferase